MTRDGLAEVGDIFESRDSRDGGRRVVVVSVEDGRYARVKRVGVEGGALGYRILHRTLRDRYSRIVFEQKWGRS